MDDDRPLLSYRIRFIVVYFCISVCGSPINKYKQNFIYRTRDIVELRQLSSFVVPSPHYVDDLFVTIDSPSHAMTKVLRLKVL